MGNERRSNPFGSLPTTFVSNIGNILVSSSRDTMDAELRFLVTFGCIIVVVAAFVSDVLPSILSDRSDWRMAWAFL